VMFIDDGRLQLDCSVEDIARRFRQVLVAPERLEAARALRPFSERRFFSKHVLFFEDRDEATLAQFGETSVPPISDLFMARTQWRVP
jgi:ABC-2 type transport system ATP-binding protein